MSRTLLNSWPNRKDFEGMRATFIVSLFILLNSCAPTSQKLDAEELDVDSLLSLQVEVLTSRGVSLTKSANVSSSPGDTTHTLVSTNWREELEVFRGLGAVNQKLYKGTYRVEDPLDDPRSNLRIRRLTNEQAPLRLMEVYYQDEVSRIREIKGILEESNLLYTARRELILHFDKLDGKAALSRYSITGFQKLALRDTVWFSVNGLVNW